MTWGRSHSFPRAILHVDGDSFFAAVEISKNPRLKGKPVVTGKERGIVSACTYDLKARGITRGMQIHEVKKLAPEAIILPSDYESYSLFAERMYAIVRRYTPEVEEYSIDECFADLTGMRRVNRMGYREMAVAIKTELQTELGISFSVGLSATKVLAKIGSKWQKPDGLTMIPLTESSAFLAKTPIGNVWGIGPNTAAYLNKYGVTTALQFAERDIVWVRSVVPKPIQEIWHELRGEMMFPLTTDKRETYQSISKTKTFTPPSRSEGFVFSQLSKNIENACIKARRWGLVSPQVFFFLKSQDFRYHGCEVTLPHPTDVPYDVIREVAKHFPRVFDVKELYRATGVTLMKLAPGASVQLDLFGQVRTSQGLKMVFESVDAISARYGKHAIFLGSSFEAMRFGAHLGDRGDAPERVKELFKGETKRRRLAIPSLGEVS
jgi:DNA polymerase-4/DNA polymerase V